MDRQRGRNGWRRRKAQMDVVGLDLQGQHLKAFGLTHLVEDATQTLGHAADQHPLAVLGNPDRVVGRSAQRRAGPRRSAMKRLEDHGDPLPAADAEGGKPVPPAAPAQLEEGGERQPGP